MGTQAFFAGLLCFSIAAHAADSSMRLIKEDERVSVYAKRAGACSADGASVLFVVENKTADRLELKLELMSAKIKNNLTVVLEPSGNTSVLSLAGDEEMCHVELTGMKVHAMPGKKSHDAAPESAPEEAIAADNANG